MKNCGLFNQISYIAKSTTGQFFYELVVWKQSSILMYAEEHSWNWQN